MKKVLFTLIFTAPLLFCGCKKNCKIQIDNPRQRDGVKLEMYEDFNMVSKYAIYNYPSIPDIKDEIPYGMNWSVEWEGNDIGKSGLCLGDKIYVVID